jgi:ribosomal protein S21|tara:strand:- start:2617 stop:2826 length:210 start_codon:yes stop_codon:yes gene_type:complete
VVKKKHRTESFDSLFRRFKKTVEKKDTINEVRKREHYVKSSTKRKLAKELAQKKEQKRQGELYIRRIPV